MGHELRQAAEAVAATIAGRAECGSTSVPAIGWARARRKPDELPSVNKVELCRHLCTHRPCAAPRLWSIA